METSKRLEKKILIMTPTASTSTCISTSNTSGMS